MYFPDHFNFLAFRREDQIAPWRVRKRSLLLKAKKLKWSGKYIFKGLVQMDIPGNDFRVKNKTIQNLKAGNKIASTKSQGGTLSTSGTEQIDISSKAKDIQKATEAVNAAPDIRIEKVDQIKEKIESGNYNVSTEQLAEKILKNMITDSKFLG
jgi:negative regulator of flagellin synthesis FlgM